METNEEKKFLENGQRYIAASSDAKKALHELVRSAAQAAGTSMGALYLTDDAQGVLKPAVVVNLPEDYVKGCGDIPLGEECCGKAALHNLPWYVADIWNDPVFTTDAREVARRAGVRAAFSVPVVNAQGKCIGTLSAHFSEPHVPLDHEIRTHIMFAQLVAVALASIPGNRPTSPDAVPPPAGTEGSPSRPQPLGK